MAENRKALHTLAGATGLSYKEIKQIFIKMWANLPDSNKEAERLIRLIRNVDD